MENERRKLIQFQNIVKDFDGQIVLKGIDLDIYENEFVTLLGPSGCGKTTLLRILGGFLEPTEGHVIFDGQDILKLPPYKRELNTVFQKYALFPHMNVYDNIAFGLKIKKMSKDIIEQKVMKMLKLINLEGYEKKNVTLLSGGQQQRVAIARALVNEPSVLLLDEPLGALDLKLRKEMQYELKRIQQEVGITFIYVTHDQTEAMTLGTRIVVMKDGVVQQVEAPIELYDNPVNLFVAGFIGSPSMNFFDAYVGEENGKVVVWLGGKNQEKKIYLKGYQAEMAKLKVMNKPVVLGVRPEDIYEYEEAKERGIEKDTQGVEEIVTAREMLGAEVFLYFDAQCKTHAVRLRPENNTCTGEKIRFYFDTERVHIFDKETEENIFYREGVQK